MHHGKRLCAFAGILVFHGRRVYVMRHFQSLGFFVPERKAVSDFLQEVTSRKDQQVSLPHACKNMLCQASPTYVVQKTAYKEYIPVTRGRAVLVPA